MFRQSVMPSVLPTCRKDQAWPAAQNSTSARLVDQQPRDEQNEADRHGRNRCTLSCRFKRLAAIPCRHHQRQDGKHDAAGDDDSA